jgi:hypothetical protein
MGRGGKGRRVRAEEGRVGKGRGGEGRGRTDGWPPPQYKFLDPPMYPVLLMLNSYIMFIFSGDTVLNIHWLFPDDIKNLFLLLAPQLAIDHMTCM